MNLSSSGKKIFDVFFEKISRGYPQYFNSDYFYDETSVMFEEMSRLVNEIKKSPDYPKNLFHFSYMSYFFLSPDSTDYVIMVFLNTVSAIEKKFNDIFRLIMPVNCKYIDHLPDCTSDLFVFLFLQDVRKMIIDEHLLIYNSSFFRGIFCVKHGTRHKRGSHDDKCYAKDSIETYFAYDSFYDALEKSHKK